MKNTLLTIYGPAKFLVWKTIALIYLRLAFTSRNSSDGRNIERRSIDTALAMICNRARRGQRWNLQQALALVELGADIKVQGYLPWRLAAWMGDLTALRRLTPSPSDALPIEAILEAHSGAVEYGHSDMRSVIAQFEVSEEQFSLVMEQSTLAEGLAQKSDMEEFARHFKNARKLLWLADYTALRLVDIDSRNLSLSFYQKAAKSWKICERIQPLIPPFPEPMRAVSASGEKAALAAQEAAE